LTIRLQMEPLAFPPATARPGIPRFGQRRRSGAMCSRSQRTGSGFPAWGTAPPFNFRSLRWASRFSGSLRITSSSPQECCETSGWGRSGDRRLDEAALTTPRAFDTLYRDRGDRFGEPARGCRALRQLREVQHSHPYRPDIAECDDADVFGRSVPIPLRAAKVSAHHGARLGSKPALEAVVQKAGI